jgi:haloacetate dehalogenase
VGDEVYAEFRPPVHDPATVTAMLEDYRAGVGIDRAHEEADRAAGRHVTCPLLVLRSSRDELEYLYGDPPSVWRPWSTDLRGGHSIDSGRHTAEEAPDELTAALIPFLRVR